MSRLSEDKRELLAYIDAILTMIEKYPTLDIGNILSNVDINVSVNPFEFLLDIIGRTTSNEEIMNFIVKMITDLLPAIELGVKGILLSNLKQTIDCINDPRIPSWLRQDGIRDNANFPSKNDDRGFIFNVKNIDYTNMLSYSPLSQVGQMKYFGTKSYYQYGEDKFKDRKYYSYDEIRRDFIKRCEEREADPTLILPNFDNIIKKSEVNNVYELARAKDFNAFLWFVINKAKFTKATKIEGKLKDYTITYDNGLTVRPFENSDDNSTVLGRIEGFLTSNSSQPLPFTPGSIITQTNGNNKFKVLSLCTTLSSNIKDLPPILGNNEYSYDLTNANDTTAVNINAEKDNNFMFLPVSSNYTSANWYVNSGTFFNFLLPEKSRKPRDYEKDFAICNIEPLSEDKLLAAKVNGVPFGFTSQETYLRFTILPSPMVHIPYIDFSTNDGKVKYSGQAPWQIKRILFDKNGTPTQDGKYTVSPINNNRYDDPNQKITTYDLGNNVKLIVNWDDGKYELTPLDPTVLFECYPGLTVYDFNYNYVMGMQLFDPAVIASQLLEMTTNIGMNGMVNFNLSVNKSETAYQMRIAEIVKNIIETTAFEASDCYYSFSNSKFNEMLEKSEIKRANGYAFSDTKNKVTTISLDDAYSILSEFDDSATLEENKDVITRAFTNATATITNEVLPEDRYNVEKGLVIDMITNLVMVIVNTMITPKIIILFEINKQLMGGHDENLTLEDLLNSLSGLITSIVLEIRDLILQELLSWVLSILSDLKDKLASMLVLEQVEFYTRLMSSLLKACKITLPKASPLDSMLDNVDYADIDVVDKPITNEC